MICLETSFLVEYLDGNHRTIEYLRRNEDAGFFSPSVCLFELYYGEVMVGRRPGQVFELREQLDWLAISSVDSESVQEATEILSELRRSGTMINKLDVVVAGDVRRRTGRIASADSDFERVDGLSVDLLT